MTARDEVIRAHKALLNGSGALAYFSERGLAEEVVKGSYIGFDKGVLTYPCIAREGRLLAIHCKSKTRDAKGKRRQWWKSYSDNLPPKGHGREPGDPAKIIPFGLEQLRGVEAGTQVVICCGEEDA